MASANDRKATVSCPFCLTLNRVDLGRVDAQPKCGACGKPILVDRPVRVTDDDLERVIGGSQVPVLVDFYADWCGPCKVMAPHLDELARTHRGRALVAKLDTDRNPGMATRFGIGGIPTLIVFREGREVAREVGAIPAPAVEALLRRGYDAGGEAA